MTQYIRYCVHLVLLALTIIVTACTTNVTPSPAPVLTAEHPTTTPLTQPPVTTSTAPTTGQTVTAVTTAPAATTAAVPSPTPVGPLRLANIRTEVLAKDLPAPDDLVLAPDGSIYLSDVSDGTVKRYTQAGELQVIVKGLYEPEGIVILPDGSLLIAEQGKNRLVHYNPQTATLTPFLVLRNRTGKLGVDEILLDEHAPNAPTLLIPDSPNGTILRATLDGRHVTTIARGFVRPTGIWVERDGNLLVVDEDGGTLVRLRSDGTREKLADLPTPDDVVEDSAGNIFVNTLGDSAIHIISAVTNQDTTLVRGLGSPQGMIFDAQSNLIVADSGQHQLVRIIIR